MREPDEPHDGLDDETALRLLVEGTATETGRGFFTALVSNLALALGTKGAWVTEYLPAQRRLRALAFRFGGGWIDHYEYDVAGTPCEPVLDRRHLFHVPDRVVELFPGDPDLRRLDAVSYMGFPLLDSDGAVLGHLAVLDTRPMPERPRYGALLRIFASRAAAELQRLRAEAELRRREARLAGLVDGAMDAIVELDDAMIVTRANPAAEKAFGCAAAEMTGRSFARFLAPDAFATVERLSATLAAGDGPRSLWIPHGLSARRADGAPFPAEATLTRVEVAGEAAATLILRDVDDRREAERRLDALAGEAASLREEIAEWMAGGVILGRSPALRRLLDDIARVAPTDATVLIQGETGTGKELVARAIHAAGPRRDRPLIRVNCAAVPASLIESEFFGHVRGAFTGATARRDGRFALADRGTLFLDEVGELPLDLQAKLLRVLQEGEFEPVGSAQTVRVDVRVIAATNRDLAREAREGRFREDLYYRLGVFPLGVPPLRERPGDVGLLAAAFAERFASRLGRALAPLTPDCLRRLEAYPWPGNVRELQNVIERAVITAEGGRLNLERAIPELPAAGPAAAPPPPVAADATILTDAELRALERANTERALAACGWRISGPEGAARRLGLSPSTLASRLRALGLRRPEPGRDPS